MKLGKVEHLSLFSTKASVRHPIRQTSIGCTRDYTAEHKQSVALAPGADNLIVVSRIVRLHASIPDELRGEIVRQCDGADLCCTSTRSSSSVSVCVCVLTR